MQRSPSPRPKVLRSSPVCAEMRIWDGVIAWPGLLRIFARENFIANAIVSMRGRAPSSWIEIVWMRIGLFVLGSRRSGRR